jgi:hypothetical protein
VARKFAFHTGTSEPENVPINLSFDWRGRDLYPPKIINHSIYMHLM